MERNFKPEMKPRIFSRSLTIWNDRNDKYSYFVVRREIKKKKKTCWEFNTSFNYRIKRDLGKLLPPLVFTISRSFVCKIDTWAFLARRKLQAILGGKVFGGNVSLTTLSCTVSRNNRNRDSLIKPLALEIPDSTLFRSVFSEGNITPMRTVTSPVIFAIKWPRTYPEHPTE